VFNGEGQFFGADAIVISDEERVTTIYHPFEKEKFLEIAHLDQQPILQMVMENGKRISVTPSLKEVAAYAQARLNLLPAEYKRFENPHVYKAGISKKLAELKTNLVFHHKTVQF
jgi:nicotinate phosphoribosyltransferase